MNLFLAFYLWLASLFGIQNPPNQPGAFFMSGDRQATSSSSQSSKSGKGKGKNPRFQRTAQIYNGF